MEFMRRRSSAMSSNIETGYDYGAIQWMRQEVEGSPVIVEANTPNYRWGSRFSIYTGLPTVVGWVWHQEQQRGEFGIMVQQREKELEDFYSTTSILEAKAFLERYKASYVIVGQVERLYYAAEGIAKFEAMNGRELRLVYANPEVQIYRWSRQRLEGVSNAQNLDRYSATPRMILGGREKSCSNCSVARSVGRSRASLT
jgi:uncharacterized membrane protein